MAEFTGGKLLKQVNFFPSFNLLLKRIMSHTMAKATLRG